ncbi:hypothetical protein HDU83_002028 [Entophlyctis luteolus]|nr:hypothetical protein HDU83_002028 [Entophlyctis luteolus]
MVQVAIFGAGLVGNYVAGMLASGQRANGPVAVSIICRKSLRTALAQNGDVLQVTHNYSGAGQSLPVPDVRSVPANALNILDDGGNGLLAIKRSGVVPDFIVIAMKRTGVDAAIKDLRDAGFTAEIRDREKDNWFWKGTCIVVLQNGPYPSKPLTEALGIDLDIIDGMFPFNVANPSGNAAHFVQGTSGHLYVSDTQSGQRFSELLTECGVDCKTSPDMTGIQHGKLVLNMNNAIGALAATTLKKELAQWQYRVVFGNCMMECIAVCAKAGIQPHSFTILPVSVIAMAMLYMPDFLFAMVSGFIVKTNDTATTSMYEDLKAHRKTEIDFLQGYISELGKQVNVPTPVCDRIAKLIRQAEEGNAGLVPHDGHSMLGDF